MSLSICPIFIYSSLCGFSVLHWHRHIDLPPCSISSLPEAGHRLCLCIEVQASFAIECTRTAASHAAFVSRKAEHWQWHGEWHIDPTCLASIFFWKLGCGASRRREDCDSVAVFVFVNYSNCVVEILRIYCCIQTRTGPKISSL